MDNFIISSELYAGAGRRFANLILDTIVYYVMIFIMAMFAGLLASFGHDGFLIWITGNGLDVAFFNIFLMLFYYLVMESLTQRTIGKYITGTKVIMEDGSKPEAGAIAIRTLCRLIPFEVFSFFGSNARGWHDSLSRTIVVDAKKYEAALNLKNSFEEIGTTEQ